MIVRRNGGEIIKAKENQEHDRGEHFWAIGRHEEYVNVAERTVVIDEEIAVRIVRLMPCLGCCKA